MAGALLVASPGGHLDELMLLVEALQVPLGDAVWVSSPTSQTRSLLEDSDVVWMPRIGSGERRRAVQALPAALRLHRRLRPSLVVSTGALFAVPHLVAAAAHRCDAWFVESATRLDGPSSTGALARRLPRVSLFAQGDGWGDPRWRTTPSVLDAFEAAPADGGASGDGRRVVVCLGTELWPFPRAVQAVLRALPDAHVTWQTGSTSVDHSGHRLQQWLPAAELQAAIARADVVVTHAGVGSVLTCLQQGKVPVVLPRTARHGEHIDDHQMQFAALLARRGLAVCVDPGELDPTHVARAAGLVARRRSAAGPGSDPLAHPLDGADDPGR